MKKIILLFAAAIFLFSGPAFAQNAGELNPASGYVIADKAAVDGDILIFTTQGLTRTNIPYSSNIFGVFNQQAIVTLETDNINEQPVSISGTALVNVTTIAGPIKKGDRITTSTIPGKGQKATGSGYALGVALADYNGSANQVGQIPVAIAKEYTGGDNGNNNNSLFRVSDAIGTALFQGIQDPKNLGQILRFIVAGLSVLTGFIISFVMFTKVVPNSIESIGRNPLAQKSIYYVTWMNIFLAIIVILIGVGAAFLILKI